MIYECMKMSDKITGYIPNAMQHEIQRIWNENYLINCVKIPMHFVMNVLTFTRTKTFDHTLN